MQKIISISFFVIFLLANTAFGEILKLPALVQHYHLHQADKADDDHDIGFVEFLKKHYSTDNTKSQTQGHDHKNLPLKNICFHAGGNCVMPSILFQEIDTFSELTSSYKTCYKQPSHTSSCFGNIWQPPRLIS